MKITPQPTLYAEHGLKPGDVSYPDELLAIWLNGSEAGRNLAAAIGVPLAASHTRHLWEQGLVQIMLTETSVAFVPTEAGLERSGMLVSELDQVVVH